MSGRHTHPTPWWRRGVADWWDGASRGARWVVVIALALIGGTAGAGLANGSLSHPAMGAALLVLVTAVGAATLATQSRLLGGWRQSVMYRRFVRSGEIPPDADAARWLPMARQTHRQMPRALGLQRVLSCAFVATAVVVMVVKGLVIDGEQAWSGLPVVAVLALVAWWLDVVGRRRGDQLGAHLPALEASAAGEDPEHRSPPDC